MASMIGGRYVAHPMRTNARPGGKTVFVVVDSTTRTIVNTFNTRKMAELDASVRNRNVQRAVIARIGQ